MRKHFKILSLLICLIALSSCNTATIETKTEGIQDPPKIELEEKTASLLFFLNRNITGSPCDKQDEILKERIIPKFKDSVEFIYVGTDKKTNDKFFSEYGIRALPTIVVLNKNGEIKKIFPPGIQNEFTLNQILLST